MARKYLRINQKNLESKIMFSCSGIMILKTIKGVISVLRAQFKILKVGNCSDLPNFISHNTNLNVKKGYMFITVLRGPR